MNHNQGLNIKKRLSFFGNRSAKLTEDDDDDLHVDLDGQGNAMQQPEQNEEEEEEEETVASEEELRAQAQAGEPRVMCALGQLLLEKGSPEAASEGEVWLLKAVAAGCVPACVAVGQLYYNGDVGLDEQPGKAEEYWMQASDQGNAEAQNLLGCYYFFEKVTNKQRMKQPATITAVAQQQHP